MTRLLIASLLFAAPVYAGHEQWPIVREKQLEERSCFALRFHTMEKCAGLSAPLPRLARVQSVPCASNPSMRCLPNGSGGWYEAGTVYVPVGNSLWFDHSVLHYLKDFNGGDPDATHSGDEWRECHR